jgi:uncharacterized protein (TIGR03083 family)
VDYVGHFGQEVAAFEAAGREAVCSQAAPAVPSCPGWVVTDLVLHLGLVHRVVARVIGERMRQPPGDGDRSWLGLPGPWQDWLPPGRAPRQSPVPAGLLDWFQVGAAELAELFRATDPGERVWTWSVDQSVGFWQRMQAIEAAVHRWDAQNAVSAAQPIDAALAADAITQTFEVMVPMRRAVAKAPPGQGERFVFRRSDGPEAWAVLFDGDAVLLGAPQGIYDIQISGTASDLALFLWQRDVTGGLEVRGDSAGADKSSVLVRRHVGTRGERRPVGRVCRCPGWSSGQGRRWVRVAPAVVRLGPVSGAGGARCRTTRTRAARAAGGVRSRSRCGPAARADRSVSTSLSRSSSSASGCR